MNKKICVYAIAKNEMKFIDRWYNSVKEADYVCVLDTGSTDGSFEKFKSLNIITEQKTFNPFRFDTARNESLKLIPPDTDICVCVDIDEFFEPGWAKILKENWNENLGRARYRYTWNFNPDGSEGTVFMADKIHKYGCYNWIHPVHEILSPTTNLNLLSIDLPQIQLNHKADDTKSRSSYLPLLELSVMENPLDDRNTHYLAREYMFHGEYEKAIEMFKKHLSLPTATWKMERCASLRYMANCYKNLAIQTKDEIKNLKNTKNNDKNIKKMCAKLNKTLKFYLNAQIKYLYFAILECPTTREPYFELALAHYQNGNYLECVVWLNEMFKITTRELNYMSIPLCWDATPYDYLSLCYYYLGDYENAYTASTKALSFGENERIKSNQNLFLNLLNNQKN